ncbi:MAG: alcohol dehydrogenase catalytic domain-containing protein [Thermodesulfobacteriota bacterium]|nr:MAG: alcohol dehydrogenase catalytic domain-containing protein [Thermodesulfobacteriota bacterium]
MRAIVFDGSPGFRADYPVPSIKPGEALVRVSYAGLCSTDLEITRGYMGFKGVMGHEFSGVVQECAQAGLQGKRVTGEINIGCGECGYCHAGTGNHCPERSVLGILKKDGAFADYLTLPVKNLHLIPEGVSDEEAVFIEPVAAAFEILEQVEVSWEDKVCVLGDGRLGLIVSQVLFLAYPDLTVVGRHEEKLSIVKKMGIKTALGVKDMGREFDMVVDCTGSGEGFADALGLVRPEGCVVLKTTVSKRGGVDLNRIVIDEITVIGSRCGPFGPAIKALAEKSIDVSPLISKIFPLEEGVEALDYASGNGVVKVLLNVNGSVG